MKLSIVLGSLVGLFIFVAGELVFLLCRFYRVKNRLLVVEGMLRTYGDTGVETSSAERYRERARVESSADVSTRSGAGCSEVGSAAVSAKEARTAVEKPLPARSESGIAPLVSPQPNRVAKVSIATKKRAGDRVKLFVPHTTDSGIDVRTVGYLEGQWTANRTFSVDVLRIDGLLSRARVLEVADQLNLRGALQSTLSRSRNDDPIVLDMEFHMGAYSRRSVTLPFRESEQEFDAALVPQIDLHAENPKITTDDKCSPLRLIVRSC